MSYDSKDAQVNTGRLWLRFFFFTCKNERLQGNGFDIFRYQGSAMSVFDWNAAGQTINRAMQHFGCVCRRITCAANVT